MGDLFREVNDKKYSLYIYHDHDGNYEEQVVYRNVCLEELDEYVKLGDARKSGDAWYIVYSIELFYEAGVVHAYAR